MSVIPAIAVFRGMKPSMRPVKKMEVMVREYETLYEEMADAQAEGRTAGYSEKPSGCRFHGCVGV